MTFLFLFYMTARLPKDESCSDPRSRRFLLTAKEGAPLDFLSSSFVQSPFKVSKINIMGHLLTIHSRVYHIFIFLSSVLENLFHILFIARLFVVALVADIRLLCLFPNAQFFSAYAGRIALLRRFCGVYI